MSGNLSETITTHGLEDTGQIPDRYRTDTGHPNIDVSGKNDRSYTRQWFQEIPDTPQTVGGGGESELISDLDVSGIIAETITVQGLADNGHVLADTGHPNTEVSGINPESYIQQTVQEIPDTLQTAEAGATNQVVPEPCTESSKLHSAFYSEEEVKANVDFIKDAIASESWEMIEQLTQEWSIAFKKSVFRLFTETEKETIRKMAPKKNPEAIAVKTQWKNCIIPDLKIGDRISCFPTFTHVQRNKPVTAKVINLEAHTAHPEYLVQIEIEYIQYRSGGSSRKQSSICGGSIQDWILRQAK